MVVTSLPCCWVRFGYAELWPRRTILGSPRHAFVRNENFAVGRAGRMTRVIDTAAAMREARTEAVKLLHAGDAARAIALVEDFSAEASQEFNLRQLQAAMYTDGGRMLKRADFVERGADLWRDLGPDSKADIAYNLANAELATYEIAVGRGSQFGAGWQKNREHLYTARALFERVATDATARTELRLQALTNAGNAYDNVGRYLDALEYYDRALAIDSRFGMALGNRGVALEHAARLMRDHAPTILMEAAENLDAAIAQPDSILRFGGPQALDWFEKVRGRIRPGKATETKARSRKAWNDPHLEWCRRHELFLHVSHGCLREDTNRLDPLFFRSVITSTDETGRDRVHRLVDAFDAIKQEYVAARYLLWLATEKRSPVREHSSAMSDRVTFLDSLQYARWGLRTGMATQALAAATNVLDKIASFVHLYLSTGRRVRGVYFEWLWQEKDSKPMDAEIAASLAGPNVNMGLLALCDLSSEVRSGTALSKRVHLRHTATHRFLVAHTEMSPPSDEWFDRVRWPDLVSEVLAQLQVARAAIIYLARMIDGREYVRGKDGTRAEQMIPGISIPVAETRLMEYE
jgi:tetratricopeptide (TPR) repeat protein